MWSISTLSLLITISIGFLKASAGSIGQFPGYKDDRNEALAAVSDRLLKYIDFDANPCEDFFEFACGGAKKQPGLDPRALVHIIQDRVDSRVDSIVRGPPNDSKQLKLLQNLFKSCEDWDGHDQNAIFRFVRSQIYKLGGIPALGERSGWIESGHKSKWTELITQMHLVGFTEPLFFKLSVDQNQTDNSKYAIYVDLPKPSGDSDNSENIPMSIASLLLPDMTVDEIRRLNKNLEFFKAVRTQLQQIFETYNSDPNGKIDFVNAGSADSNLFWLSKKYQSISIKSLELIAPEVDLTSLFSGVLQRQLEPDTRIFVYKPEVVGRVLKLINGLDHEVLRNYIMFEGVYQFYKGANFYGLNVIKQYLGLILSAEYVRDYFLPETRANATVLVDYLKQEQKSMIEKLDWISDSAKQEVLKKANYIISYVGYPDELFNLTLMDGLFAGLELDPVDLGANLLHLARWKSLYDTAKLDRTPKMDGWQLFSWATEVNAVYQEPINSINIFAAIMQDVIYNSRQPNYVNFGILGSIVGHELSHAFDSDNAKYDCNFQDHCWWDPKTEANYKTRVRCFEDQYYANSRLFANYSWFSGSQTLGENIADNIGIKIARQAYQNWLANSLDQPISDLEPIPAELGNLTREQLFWTSNAQFYCNSLDPDQVRKIFINDEHSPDKLRVDITFQNQIEFAQDFNCPIGSRMNPRDKCSMW